MCYSQAVDEFIHETTEKGQLFFFHGMMLFNQEAEKEKKTKKELNVRWLEMTSSSNHYEKISIDWKGHSGVFTITKSNHSCCTFQCILSDSLASILPRLMYMNTTSSKRNVPVRIHFSAFKGICYVNKTFLFAWLIFHSVKILMAFLLSKHWLYSNIPLTS